MPSTTISLSTAKRAFNQAVASGHHLEEARWANFIGNLFKNQGQYVEALQWIRKDYQVSQKHLAVEHQIPSCQSLGEVYFRLQNFKQALVYQKKHLLLAKDENDLVEQQRASTQLGRTHYELFLKNKSNHWSLRKAKKYFKLAMELAENLKKNPPIKGQTFVKEYIDAHNNLGMLEVDLDNLELAQEILTKGLEICDEEEVNEHDDGRSRLHHNLGNVYMELRNWDEAIKHIKEDISICHRIEHCQGEAKGYINLGELHCRNQRYPEATVCYNKAHKLAKSMMDEDALVRLIEENIETVEVAVEEKQKLQKEVQKLKRLERKTEEARGKGAERDFLLQQYASLGRLLEGSHKISAWEEHCKFAKRKEKIARKLCDQEKLGDSLLDVGESYLKLRNFDKALGWYRKSWETYQSIGNLEGQALAKINIGNALDAIGDWDGALSAFAEGYEIACQANHPSTQETALQNMHYSHMIRFGNFEEARKLQKLIDELNSKPQENTQVDCCYETEADNGDLSPDCRSTSDSKSSRTILNNSGERINDDLSEISLPHPCKSIAEPVTANAAVTIKSESSTKRMSSFTNCQIGCKRAKRVVLSDDDDEDEDGESLLPRVLDHMKPLEDDATSDQIGHRSKDLNLAHSFQDVSPGGSGAVISACTPLNNEGVSLRRCRSTNIAVQTGQDTRISCTDDNVDFKLGSNDYLADANTSVNLTSEYKYSSHNLIACFDDCEHILFKIHGDLLHIKRDSFLIDVKFGMEQALIEIACLYFLQLPAEKRSRGLAPVIQGVIYGGKYLESLEAVKSLKQQISTNDVVDVCIGAWVPKHLMKLYIDSCEKLSEQPNLKVLKKLYGLEVSEDEVVVTDCDLQDLSVAPLLSALHAKMIAVLDLSHNVLGNGTMEQLRQVFTSSGQTYGGLVLDLHCNRLGPSALFQICECPVLYARLEVLNISGNRLTDSCASYLSNILQNCKALYNLNIEKCSITSRTIQKVADSLDSGSVLSHLYIGHNNPVSGSAITNLLLKLAAFKRIQELSLNGIKLSKTVIDSLSDFFMSSCLTGVMLGGTSIGTEGATLLTQKLSKETQEVQRLDLSSCGLTSAYLAQLNVEAALTSSIAELNLGANPIKEEGVEALVSLLVNPKSCLRVLVLSNCQLELVGMVQILEALAENSLEELNLAENACLEGNHSAAGDLIFAGKSPTNSKKHLSISETSDKALAPEVKPSPNEFYGVDTDISQLEVADSEDDEVLTNAAESVVNEKSGPSVEKPNLDDDLYHELSAAICKAKHLKLLDLSNNGISQEVAEMLYVAWSSCRDGTAERHIEENIVHLSLRGRKCCNLKPCCRRS